jgi:hypothetical protein
MKKCGHMCSRWDILFAALLLPFAGQACKAQTVVDAPWMTGQRLLEMIPQAGAFDEATGQIRRKQATLKDEFDRIRAESYIDGVHDSTEGKTWCFSKQFKPKPDTLHSQIIWGLRALTRDELQRSAADLIVEVWREKYPCKLEKGQQ